MNFTPTNAEASAFIASSPPYTFAGKNLTIFNPASSASMISEGVAHPGSAGIPCAAHSSISSQLKPGETINIAPITTPI